MALAPVVYCLWQHFLRFDLKIRPGRTATVLCLDRPCLHVAFYSLLHLCGGKAVNLSTKRWGSQR